MRKSAVLLLSLGLLVASATVASASSLLLDRGLPTSNLNNAAGASRSNVQWAFTQATANDYYLVGDDFTIGGSGSYFVDTLRLWSSSSANLSLWFGAAGGSITELSGAPTVTPVTYSGGAGYQGTSGNFSQIYQLDFTLNQSLSAGTTYQFFLDGLIAPYGATTIVDAYVHSSNAGLSGSLQQGSDNLLLYTEILNGVSGSDIGSWDSNGNGWNRSSDGNVQVFGTAEISTAAVPEPSSLFLLGTGLLGLAQFARRRLSANRS